MCSFSNSQSSHTHHTQPGICHPITSFPLSPVIAVDRSPGHSLYIHPFIPCPLWQRCVHFPVTFEAAHSSSYRISSSMLRDCCLSMCSRALWLLCFCSSDAMMASLGIGEDDARPNATPSRGTFTRTTIPFEAFFPEGACV